LQFEDSPTFGRSVAVAVRPEDGQSIDRPSGQGERMLREGRGDVTHELSGPHLQVGLNLVEAVEQDVVATMLEGLRIQRDVRLHRTCRLRPRKERCSCATGGDSHVRHADQQCGPIRARCLGDMAQQLCLTCPGRPDDQRPVSTRDVALADCS
jgi:hypothetical protein